jgi:hypothetical protein
MFLVALAICYGLLWLYALIDCLRRKDLRGREKLAWCIAMLATSFIGMFCCYAFCSRKQRALARRYDKALDPLTGRPYI